ncbi:MAG: hypothetical protein QOE90_3330 [Thermoplasmata archaeon]|jgi:hypothetical protein|nr:hypothetical protein [Thermoplasmata archaeon]
MSAPERLRLVGFTHAQAAWLLDLAKAELKRLQEGPGHYHDFDAHMVSNLLGKLHDLASELAVGPRLLDANDIEIVVRLDRESAPALARVLISADALRADDLDHIITELARSASTLRPGAPARPRGRPRGKTNQEKAAHRRAREYDIMGPLPGTQDERVWQAVRHGAQDTATISRMARIPRTHVQPILNRLRERGNIEGLVGSLRAVKPPKRLRRTHHGGGA